MEKENRNYRDQDVYVGLDVHKKSYSVVVLSGGCIVKKATVPADAQQLVESLKSWFCGAKIHTAYEAGFSGFRLHRVLVESGIDNIVVNAASIEVAANDKKKTDKRDAKKIAEQLAAGRLTGIYIPTIEEELRRQITRTRQQIVKERSRIANKIKSRLHYFGFIAPEDDRVVSEEFISWLDGLNLPNELRLSIDLLVEEWRLLAKQIKLLRTEIYRQAAKNPEIKAVYESVPGIGEISAGVLTNELGDLAKRFKSQDALYQYTGLTPAEYSSGENIHRGHIDRQGSSRIRHVLVEASWRAIREDGALMEFFNRIAVKRGKKRAIVAVARKLIGRIRACFVHQQPYALGLIA
jgi:transposase